MSNNPTFIFLTQDEQRLIYAHRNVQVEIQFLQDYLIIPIKLAGQAIFQTDLDR